MTHWRKPIERVAIHSGFLSRGAEMILAAINFAISLAILTAVLGGAMLFITTQCGGQ